MSLELNFGDAVIKAAPVIGAGAAETMSRFLGFTLHEWFYVATIGYVIVQSWALIYKTLKGGKDE